jgi:tripartite-type tricarboxylate transporter receptor subunit TctC
MTTIGARLLAASAAMVLYVAGSLTGAAQTAYPSRTVRVVVSFPPGSATDLVARLLADRLNRKWNVSVVVENVTGAAGQIGTGASRRARTRRSRR